MDFPPNIVQSAWDRSDGKCECKRNIHKHKNGVCQNSLIWEKRDFEGGSGAWATHHIVPMESGGDNILENCEVLCYECHKTAASYGVF